MKYFCLFSVLIEGCVLYVQNLIQSHDFFRLVEIKIHIIGNSQYYLVVVVHQVTAPQKECISVIEIGGYFLYKKLYQSVHGSSYFRADDFKQWIIYAGLAAYANAGLERYICLSMPSHLKNELVRRWVHFGIGSCTCQMDIDVRSAHRTPHPDISHR